MSINKTVFRPIFVRKVSHEIAQWHTVCGWEFAPSPNKCRRSADVTGFIDQSGPEGNVTRATLLIVVTHSYYDFAYFGG